MYLGSGTSDTISGLTAASTYYFKIYELNGSGGTENYLTTNPPSASVTTPLAEPTIQTSNIHFSSLTSSAVTVGFNAGNGSSRIVLVHAGASVNSNPSDQNSYTANSIFGSGTQVGTGNYVVLAGADTTVTVTGLSSAVTYYFNVYEFNGSNGTENYLSTSPSSGSVTTPVTEPTSQASNVQISSVTAATMTISCTKGNGNQRLFVVRAGSTVSGAPVDNVTYTASSIFGSGSQTTSGNYVVYKDTGSSVTVTGLSQLTTYYISVYEFNGNGGAENYLVTSPASGSATTLFNGITSTATGGVWATASTWAGGVVPGTGDNVLIASGATVSLSTSATVLSTTISSGGRLNISASVTLNGDIICNGTLGGSSNVLTTNGNLTVSGTSASFTFSSNTGKVIQTAARTFTLANGATFEHAASGVSPLDSVVRVSGGTWTWVVDNSVINTTVSYKNSSNTTVITALPNGQSYGNLIIKSPSTSASADWVNKLGASLTILGNFSIQNTTSGSPGARNMGFNLQGFTLSGNNINSALTLSNTTSLLAATIRLINSTGKVVTDFAASFPGFTTANFTNTSLGIDTIPGGAYANIVLSGTGAKITNASATVSGSLTLASGSLTLGSGKTLSYGAAASLIYNGSTAQSTGVEYPSSSGPYNVTLNNSLGLTVSAARTLAGTLTLGGNGTYTNLSNLSGYSGIIYGATVAQTTGSELPASINYLTVNNANGVALGTSVIVNTTLAMTSGKLALGSYNLTVGGSISGTMSALNMILASGSGELRKVFTSTPSSFTFPVGTGTTYSPVSLTLNSGTLSSAYIGVKVAAQKSSNNTSSSDYLNRTWTLTSSGITNPVYRDSLLYVAGDVVGTESNLVGGLYSASAWNSLGAVDAVNHYITGSGLTSFGDFTAGDASAFSSSGIVNVKVIQQGFYNVGGYLNASDTITVLLANVLSPYAFIDSARAILDSLTFTASATFRNSASGNYYLIVKHRNCIETWSASAISFTRGAASQYDFTDDLAKAYGGNLTKVSDSPVRWAIYSGDVNQDGYVDPLDLSSIDQESFNYASGLGLSTDINGDGYVDPLDLSITDQNSFNYVGIQRPVSVNLLVKRVRPTVNSSDKK